MTSAPERLLIVKPSSFGDLIHTLPALDAIHRSWPRTAVDWIVKPEWRPLLEGHPMLREVLPFPLSVNAWRRTIPLVRQRRYDMVLDFQGLLRSGLLSLCTGAPVRIGFADGREGSPWCYTQRVELPTQAPMHAIDRYLHLAGQAGVSIQPPTRFPLPAWPEADRWIDRCWVEAGIQPQETVCVIHPAARWMTKRWPADRFAALADRLVKEQGWRVILVAGAGERSQAESVGRLMRQRVLDLSGRTTLPQLAALLRRAAMVVTNDSGPMHLAAAVGTPVVALFGPTDPRKIGPYGPGHLVLQAGIDCSPCSRQRCAQDGACLNAISVDEAYAAVLRLDRGKKPALPPNPSSDVRSVRAMGIAKGSESSSLGLSECSARAEGMMAMDQELLSILACPKCKGEIQLTPEQDGLICRTCGLKYPIKDEIPIMLIDEAIKI